MRVFRVIQKEVSQFDDLKLHRLVSLLQGFAAFGGIQTRQALILPPLGNGLAKGFLQGSISDTQLQIIG